VAVTSWTFESTVLLWPKTSGIGACGAVVNGSGAGGASGGRIALSPHAHTHVDNAAKSRRMVTTHTSFRAISTTLM
jgi:hypothetical protein